MAGYYCYDQECLTLKEDGTVELLLINEMDMFTGTYTIDGNMLIISVRGMKVIAQYDPEYADPEIIFRPIGALYIEGRIYTRPL